MSETTHKSSRTHEKRREPRTPHYSELTPVQDDDYRDTARKIVTSTDSPINPTLLNPKTILQLQRTIGNHAVRQLLATPSAASGHIVQREGDEAKQHRDFVELTIQYLKLYTSTKNIDQASFEWSMNRSYEAVVKAEKLIDDKLAGDKQEHDKLQKAYRDTMTNYMPEAAKVLGKDLSTLYNENRGRMPIWGWQVPHHTEAGISTPIPEGAAADPLTGEVNMTINGIPVKILPDAKDPKLGNGAETKINKQSTGQFGWEDKNKKITSITSQPSISITIQTFYGDKVTASDTSAYGRGTTAEDQAGAKVTPESGSLGFHEGSHGFDFIELLKKTPPPQFAGAVDDKVKTFKKAITTYDTDWKKYIKDINDQSEQLTDEVGTKKSSLTP